jgi:hypothetical protein
MRRTARAAPGGLVSYVLNRAVVRLRLFAKEADYEAFERVLAEALGCERNCVPPCGNTNYRVRASLSAPVPLSSFLLRLPQQPEQRPIRY